MIERHFHDLIVDGKSLADFGVHVSGTGVFNSPERDYEVVEVPGRSGDLLFSKNRYKNYELTYPAFVLYHFREKIAELRAFLLSRKGYVRIEDTYHPDEFRLGYFQGPLEFDPILLTGSEFEIKFNVKPQRFLKYGETVQTFESTSLNLTQIFQIVNPTYFSSKPIIKIYRTVTSLSPTDSTDETQTFSVGNHIVSIMETGTDHVIIDSETQDAHSDTNQNLNSRIILDRGTFPELDPGTNAMMITNFKGSTVSKIEITPRWYTL